MKGVYIDLRLGLWLRGFQLNVGNFLFEVFIEIFQQMPLGFLFRYGFPKVAGRRISIPAAVAIIFFFRLLVFYSR